MFKKLNILLALGALCAFGLVAENAEKAPKMKKQKREHVNKKHRMIEYYDSEGNLVSEEGVATISENGSGSTSCGKKYCGERSCNKCTHTEQSCPPAPLCEKSILVPAKRHKRTYTDYVWECPSDATMVK